MNDFKFELKKYPDEKPENDTENLVLVDDVFGEGQPSWMILMYEEQGSENNYGFRKLYDSNVLYFAKLPYKYANYWNDVVFSKDVPCDRKILALAKVRIIDNHDDFREEKFIFVIKVDENHKISDQDMNTRFKNNTREDIKIIGWMDLPEIP